MSFFTPQFQIASNLHLETPLTTPRYGSFRLNVQADNLLLLGDIGLVVDNELFQFLRRILEQNRGCRIFYVLGNHEPYRTTYEHAYKLLRDFEQEAKGDLGGRFIFLCRDRYNLNKTITILGCTLWSAIQQDQESEILSRSIDLSIEHGIENWTLERHRQEHEQDLAWLNSQVSAIEEAEPYREIIVVTHYSPTTDSRANDPKHEGSAVSSNFATDLSHELCWLSPVVKLWAFGHTHYSCSFRDEKTGKLLVANQKGYAGLGAGRKKAGLKAKVVEAGKEGWEVLERTNSSREEQIKVPNMQADEEVLVGGRKDFDLKTPKISLLHRMTKRIQGFRGSQRKSS